MLADAHHEHLALSYGAHVAANIHIPSLLPIQPAALAACIEDVPHRLCTGGVNMLLAGEVFPFWGDGECVEADAWGGELEDIGESGSVDYLGDSHLAWCV